MVKFVTDGEQLEDRSGITVRTGERFRLGAADFLFKGKQCPCSLPDSESHRPLCRVGQCGKSPGMKSTCFPVSESRRFIGVMGIERGWDGPGSCPFGIQEKTERIKSLVYSVTGWEMMSSGTPSSTIFPPCITRTRWQSCCTSARLWQMNR